MDQSSDDDESSEAEENDQEVFKMLKDTMIAKGIKTEKKMNKIQCRFLIWWQQLLKLWEKLLQV